MGTEHRSIAPSKSPRRSSFRRQFAWYVLSVLATAFIITIIVEGAAIFLVAALSVQFPALFTQNRLLQRALMVVLVALPWLILIGSILFFAWHMGRSISRPVKELMQAVEKIRQQDLSFRIHYQEPNELGDLCYAFNELRRELQESLEREWRKQEEMRTLVAALSHDLRTPVTIIQGHVEGLARAQPGEKRSQRLERYLPVLEASSQRMTRLLNDILLVSSLEQTSVTIQPAPVCLEEMMDHKARIYTLQAAAQEINFSYNYHSEATPTTSIVLDQHRLEQVLDNLFENALRATPAHGKITLLCSYQRSILSLTLQDTGPGITPEDLPHVFEKFYRGKSHSDDHQRQAGGLGLYICKLFVEKHGGAIALHNRPTGGCQANVSVPTPLVAGTQ